MFLGSKKYFLFLFFTLPLMVFSQAQKKRSDVPPFVVQPNTQWVDSVFNSLTPDERIAQLFMVAAYSNKDQAHIDGLAKLITDYNIGGLIFFQGGPVRHARMLNHLQTKAQTPLLIGMDAEWGPSMRLDSCPKFPRQMTLGAISNDDIIYDMGVEIARQCKRIGVHVNFAPVIDVNSNAANPVIGTRSFGEDKVNVAKKGIAYMNGMQDNGVLACGKHFPGHGDTDSDSHLTLPVIKHDKARMDSLELYPFKELIANGLGSMMVAHLFIPAYDDRKNTASTLSPYVVDTLLKGKLGFEGLVFTDALNMQGVSKFYKPGIVDVKAMIAGNDVMLFSEDVPTAIREIKKAIENKELTQADIDERCKKVLMAKAWAGLDNYKEIEVKNIVEDLNAPSAEAILKRIANGSATLVINKDEVLPLKRLDTLTVASVVIGDAAGNDFQKTLSKYDEVTHFALGSPATAADYTKVMSSLDSYNTVIISIHKTSSRRSENYGITQQMLDFINILNNGKRKLILNVFANPYALGRMPGSEKVNAFILSYENTVYSQEAAAQLVFGGIAASGKMPVTANRQYREGDGEMTEKIRFSYSVPEELGIKSKHLAGIDSIVKDAIKMKAMPGCQILIAKDGVVIYEKNFGHFTYDEKKAVTSDDLYDLASVTKISASLLGLMKLVDEKKINIDEKLSKYLPELMITNKKNMVLREVLAHQAGFKSWIPFYMETIKEGKLDTTVYSKTKSEAFPLRVAENLYCSKTYVDTIYDRINKSNVNSRKDYLYSDLGYYYIKKILEKQTGEPLDEYVQKHFYKQLGMTTMGYKPREHFPLDRIVPTELDVAFRHQQIQGDVHDQGAAMMGGVCGHAGLFSNANDLAKLMQMYCNYGEYGGERYISEETMKEFTKCQFCANGNRRGIGFDKPDMKSDKGPTCSCISYMSFGHSGFTGTYAWADPDKDVVYIFLSNRVYPDAENKKLITMNVRTKIQEVIYNAVE